MVRRRDPHDLDMHDAERHELEHIRPLLNKLRGLIGSADPATLARSPKIYPAALLVPDILAKLETSKSPQLRKSKVSMTFRRCFDGKPPQDEAELARRLDKAARPLDALIASVSKR